MDISKGIDIIMLSVSRWDQGLSSASISMAKELSKENRVFYIDHPFTYKDILKDYRKPSVRQRREALFFGRDIYRRIEAENPNLIAVTPLAMIPINWLPEGKLFEIFSRFNNWLFFKTIRKIIKDYAVKNFVYWNSYNPFYSHTLPPDINPKVFIYQSRDNIAESEYVKKHGPRLELIAAKNANLRLATSSDLVKKLDRPEKPFIFFPNAANTNVFSKASRELQPKPKELAEIDKPVIGYIGNICLRQDYDLIYKIAITFKDNFLVLVGPRNDRRYNSYNFESLENVLFTGQKDLDELPAYLAYMDVAIVPFLVNELTKSIYPLKLNEYLAAGKPVVSTNFSPDLEHFKDVVYISSSHEEFLDNLRKALNDDTMEKRLARVHVAWDNSWTSRVSQFWKIIGGFRITEN